MKDLMILKTGMAVIAAATTSCGRSTRLEAEEADLIYINKGDFMDAITVGKEKSPGYCDKNRLVGACPTAADA